MSQKSYCINIAGVPENFEIIDVPIDDITLDEENPRIGYYKDNYSFVIDHFSQEQVKLGLKALWLPQKRLTKPFRYSNRFVKYPALAFVAKIIA